MAVQVTAGLWRNGDAELRCESIRIYQAPDRSRRAKAAMTAARMQRLRRAWITNATSEELAADRKL